MPLPAVPALPVRAGPWVPGLMGAALVSALGPLGGCSAGSAAAVAAADPAPTPPACRALLRTASDWPALPPLAAEVARRSALPVQSLAAITPRLFALTLQAADPAACSAALARLGADPGFALGVDPDRHRTRPAAPAASTSQ
ncbi:MAG: hypothetical protein KGJ24_09925 [Burkholderiales bacterium]|nr:hypothetical protein [Burkholderiales bacterium]